MLLDGNCKYASRLSARQLYVHLNVAGCACCFIAQVGTLKEKFVEQENAPFEASEVIFWYQGWCFVKYLFCLRRLYVIVRMLFRKHENFQDILTNLLQFIFT